MTTSSNIVQPVGSGTARTASGIAPDPTSTAFRLRRWVGAICLPGLFVLMIVGSLIDPLDDSADSAGTLAQAAGHTGSIAALSWLELAGAVVTVAGLLAFVGAVRRRGAGWANAVGVLGTLFAVGQVAIACNHWVVVALTRASLPADVAVRALDAFHSAGGPVAILFFLPSLTYLFLAIAAWRGGLVPKAALVLGVLFFLVFAVPGEVGQFIADAVGLGLTGWVAVSLVRGVGPDEALRAVA